MSRLRLPLRSRPWPGRSPSSWRRSASTSIVPGLVDTPLVSGMFGDRHDDAMQAVGKSLPVGRVGQPEDIADAVLFLMGNGYVTGTTLIIDGGRLLI